MVERTIRARRDGSDEAKPARENPSQALATLLAGFDWDAPLDEDQGGSSPSQSASGTSGS
jgi:hypothetical protein